MGVVVEKLNGMDIEEIFSRIIDAHRGRVGSIIVYMGVVKTSSSRNPPLNFPEDAWYILNSEIEGAAAKYMTRRGILELRIYHTTGSPEVGETVIYIIVAAEDRGSAFDVARKLLEDIKMIHARLST